MDTEDTSTLIARIVADLARLGHVIDQTVSATPQPAAEPAPQKLLFTAEEAAETLGLGRTVVFELLRSGRLESVKIGSRRRISMAALQSYVSSLGTSQGAGAA